MIVHIIFGQRICRYEGQYAPEALEVITEYGNEENPDFLTEKLEFYKSSKEFTAVEIVDVKINDAALDKILKQTRPKLEGEIV